MSRVTLVEISGRGDPAIRLIGWVITVAGIVTLVLAAGWFVLLGVMLCLWGNNLERQTR